MCCCVLLHPTGVVVVVVVGLDFPGPPSAGPPKISLFFSLSRHRFALSVSLWVSSRQPENSKRAHFRAPVLQNTTKIPREDPQRDTKRVKWWREREEKGRNFGPPTLRAPTFLGLDSPPFGAPPFGAQKGAGSSMFCLFSEKEENTDTVKWTKSVWPKSVWPKSENKDGQSRSQPAREAWQHRWATLLHARVPARSVVITASRHMLPSEF